MLGLSVPGRWTSAAPAVDEVAQAVRVEIERQKIPGLALLVARNGEPIRAEGYGLANVELSVPVKPETLFQSGSVGKQFTATAVMMLVEAGKLGLNDPLTKFFPQAPAWWAQVTVGELLSHTAGFTDYPKDFDLRKDYTEEQLLKIVEAIPPAYPPGTRWSYSNLGLPDSRHPDSSSHRRILWRLYSAEDFQAAQHVDGPHNQRGRHYSEPLLGVPPGEWTLEESGVGLADGKHDRGR